jgi:hypothetical protein
MTVNDKLERMGTIVAYVNEITLGETEEKLKTTLTLASFQAANRTWEVPKLKS